MTVTPAHCPKPGRSPIQTTATKIVNKGLVARIGAATEIGRCFRAYNARIHETPTSRDLMASKPCCCQLMLSTTIDENGIHCGAVCDSSSGPDQMMKAVTTFSSSTGGTALLRTADFLAMSYRPRNMAELKLSKIQFMQTSVVGLPLPHSEQSG